MERKAVSKDQLQFFEKENNIFIAKLNDICENYDKAFGDVKRTRDKVNVEIQPEQERMNIKIG